MSNLFTWDYWFNLRPEALSPLAQNLFIGLIIILALLALNHGADQKSRRPLPRHLKQFILFRSINAMIGLILLFFNYETVPFFSARFWLGLWVIIVIIWLFFLLKKFKAIPAKKKQLAAEQELKKYLP